MAIWKQVTVSHKSGSVRICICENILRFVWYYFARLWSFYWYQFYKGGKMDRLTSEQRKAWVTCLSIDCPLENALDSCPVNAIRKMSVSDRVNSMHDISDEQIDKIMSHHQNCLRQREGGKIINP